MGPIVIRLSAGTEGDSMKSPVYFQQGCRVCGRWLQIPVTLLGKRVYCQHCGGGFVAADASVGASPGGGRHVDDLIARADAVLQQAAKDSGSGDEGWQSDD